MHIVLEISLHDSSSAFKNYDGFLQFWQHFTGCSIQSNRTKMKSNQLPLWIAKNTKRMIHQKLIWWNHKVYIPTELADLLCSFFTLSSQTGRETKPVYKCCGNVPALQFLKLFYIKHKEKSDNSMACHMHKANQWKISYILSNDLIKKLETF